MKYHAHIYFEWQDEAKARLLARRASEDLQDRSVKLVGFHPAPVGPHPKGMFEMHFDRSALEKVKLYFLQEASSFRVLIHEDTGDDLADHTDGTLWLGRPLLLNFEFFD